MAIDRKFKIYITGSLIEQGWEMLHRQLVKVLMTGQTPTAMFVWGFYSKPETKKDLHMVGF
jgi:uracil DNA glycosylase